MRKLFAILLIAAVLTVSSSATVWQSYDDINQMVYGGGEGGIDGSGLRGASLIVIGTVVSEEIIYDESEMTDDSPYREAFTLSSIKITEVIFGKERANTINVGANGMEDPPSDVADSTADGPFLDVGTEYLLFLWENTGENWGNIEDDYYLVMQYQGYHTIDDNGRIIAGWHNVDGLETLDGLRELIAAGNTEPYSNPNSGISISLLPMITVGIAAFFSRKKENN